MFAFKYCNALRLMFPDNFFHVEICFSVNSIQLFVYRVTQKAAQLWFPMALLLLFHSTECNIIVLCQMLFITQKHTCNAGWTDLG